MARNSGGPQPRGFWKIQDVREETRARDLDKSNGEHLVRGAQFTVIRDQCRFHNRLQHTESQKDYSCFSIIT